MFGLKEVYLSSGSAYNVLHIKHAALWLNYKHYCGDMEISLHDRNLDVHKQLHYNVFFVAVLG
jgi:hypothetical protein